MRCKHPLCMKPAVWQINMMYVDDQGVWHQIRMHRCLEHARVHLDIKDIVSTENVVSGTER